MAEDSRNLVTRIAGSVVMSSSPGLVLKSWRQRLRIRQISLAREMGVSPSVLSDYEKGRRSSPGVGFVRRYVEALLRLDKAEGRILERSPEAVDSSAILAIGEFERPIPADRILQALEGRLLVGENLASWSIYGYTVLDSIRTIYALSGFDFYRIFGATSERVVVFTKVGLGRSPLVAIRVSQLKPRMVVLHRPKAVDPLAIELAKKERIILAVSSAKSESLMAKRLTEL